ncbi:MAG: hypothetical protein KatS3mg112_0512 [Thermogutta sp.]|nr:MAG: hypothetical protein KatS3mg112_0512 [Thermogutta sp.]
MPGNTIPQALSWARFPGPCAVASIRTVPGLQPGRLLASNTIGQVALGSRMTAPKMRLPSGLATPDRISRLHTAGEVLVWIGWIRRGVVIGGDF